MRVLETLKLHAMIILLVSASSVSSSSTLTTLSSAARYKHLNVQFTLYIRFPLMSTPIMPQVSWNNVVVVTAVAVALTAALSVALLLL